MTGLGGLNRSPGGVVLGLCQLQLPDRGHQERSRPADRAHLGPGHQGQEGDAHPGSGGVPRVRPARPVDGHQPGDHVPARRSRGGGVQDRVRAREGVGLLLDHGAEPARQPVEQRHHPRRPRRAAALLPQDAPVDAGRALGARQPRHPGVRRPERQQAGAHHLPRRHVPRDGARVRLQGRQHHAANRGLHRPDPPGLAGDQPGQRLLQPDVHRQRLHVPAATAPSTRWARPWCVDFEGTVIASGRRRARRDRHRRGAPRAWPARPGAAGAWRTTSTSSATAATSRSRAARRTAPTRSCATWSPANTACPGKPRCRSQDGTSCGFPAPTRNYTG